jgi:hypothetical protein
MVRGVETITMYQIISDAKKHIGKMRNNLKNYQVLLSLILIRKTFLVQLVRHTEA